MRRWLIIGFVVVSLLGGVATVQGQGAAITHGPLSGEVTATTVNLWARGSQAGTLRFEVAEGLEFAEIAASGEVVISTAQDLVGQVTVQGLKPATQYYYRVALEGGAAKQGAFRTAPAPESSAAFSFLLGACLGGQGYCRDPQTGWQIFQPMLAENPDFFLLTGDGVYASGVCPTENNRNVAGAERLPTDLESFRARYRYHLEDEHYANFLAKVPVYVGWDDHEVRDNYSAPLMAQLNPQLLHEARQAYFDYWALEGKGDQFQLYRSFRYGAHAEFFILDTRSYRDPIVNWDPSPRTLTHKTMLGAEQLAWLKAGLQNSSATWKFIVSSVPLAYPTGFPQPEVDGRDGWANGADRSGYEHELMGLLFYLFKHDVKNFIFLTGDVHWAYALSFDVDRDGQPDFYELSSSPLSAIVLPPTAVDQTFNPSVLFAEGDFQGTQFNYGRLSLAEDGELTFQIKNREGETRYSLSLTPMR